MFEFLSPASPILHLTNVFSDRPPFQVTCFEAAAPPGGVLCSAEFRAVLLGLPGGPGGGGSQPPPGGASGPGVSETGPGASEGAGDMEGGSPAPGNVTSHDVMSHDLTSHNVMVGAERSSMSLGGATAGSEEEVVAARAASECGGSREGSPGEVPAWNYGRRGGGSGGGSGGGCGVRARSPLQPGRDLDSAELTSSSTWIAMPHRAAVLGHSTMSAAASSMMPPTQNQVRPCCPLKI